MDGINLLTMHHNGSGTGRLTVSLINRARLYYISYNHGDVANVLFNTWSIFAAGQKTTQEKEEDSESVPVGCWTPQIHPQKVLNQVENITIIKQIRYVKLVINEWQILLLRNGTIFDH